MALHVRVVKQININFLQKLIELINTYLDIPCKQRSARVSIAGGFSFASIDANVGVLDDTQKANVAQQIGNYVSLDVAEYIADAVAAIRWSSPTSCGAQCSSECVGRIGIRGQTNGRNILCTKQMSVS